jgi:ABC-type branched-subunit amino acid transport system ATPase component
VSQAQRWIQETGAPSSSTADFERRPLGSLAPLHRRLLDLSAAAAQAPRLIVIVDADAGLGAGDLDRLEAICREFAHHSGAGIVLIGAALGGQADWRPPPPQPPEPRQPALVDAEGGQE